MEHIRRDIEDTEGKNLGWIAEVIEKIKTDVETAIQKELTDVIVIDVQKRKNDSE